MGRATSKLVAGTLFAMVCTAAGLGTAIAEEIRGRVVGEDGQGIADAVVFATALPNGADGAADPPTAVMDQVNKEFVPHILPIAVGTEVSFPNHDQIHHHVYSFSRPKTFEIPLYKGETAAPVRFDQEGAVKIGCNIHDWMAAVILVVPNRYFAKTDESGRFRIAAVPPGKLRLAAWHERSQVAVEGTARDVEASNAGDLTFSLKLAPPRPRPAMHGLRSME
jgi:plastocyanin